MYLLVLGVIPLVNNFISRKILLSSNSVVAYCSVQALSLASILSLTSGSAGTLYCSRAYLWVHIRNRSPFPGLGRFFGLVSWLANVDSLSTI